MLFNSAVFVCFFLLVYLLYRVLPFKWQNPLLLTASIIFYGYWDWRFLTLIFTSTVVDYLCGIRMEKVKGSKRRIYLILSVVLNLGLLGFFKYFNFFTDNVTALLELLGFTVHHRTLSIILPVGISFYTFQTMSYTIDVYRGIHKPEHHFINFATYVSFFPQLVAGPIERANHFLPQIQNPRKVTASDIQNGLWMILWGYFLKLVVADNLAEVVNAVYNSQNPVGGLDILFGTYAFAFQIYGDFAGYSAIAIGIAQLMGFHLTTNFLLPYFVTSPSEFWRNWHISLSRWLRDYLYISLGGNRLGRIKTYRNLALTMLFGGLWHGAAWNFVIWGGFHGIILMIDHAIRNRRKESRLKSRFHILKMVLMFHVTCIGWLLFRATSLQQIVSYSRIILLQPFSMTAPTRYFVSATLFYSAFPLLINAIQYRCNCPNSVSTLRLPLRIVLFICMIYLTLGLGNLATEQFIYFQF